MKKFLLIHILALFSAISLFAQNQPSKVNEGPFKHLAFGLSLGTGGIGFDAATTLSPYLQARIGAELFPPMTLGVTIGTSDRTTIVVEGESINLDYDMTFNVEPHMSSYNVILDYYPWRDKGFHVSVGAFFGSNWVNAVNDSYPEEIKDLQNIWKYNHTPNENGNLPSPIGIQIGPYCLEPDQNGRVEALFEAQNTVQPYIGIGYGRAVPKWRFARSTPYNKRVSYMIELGARFWGTPKLSCNGIPIDDKTLEEVSGQAMLKAFTQLPFYPEIKFRLCGKIF